MIHSKGITSLAIVLLAIFIAACNPENELTKTNLLTGDKQPMKESLKGKDKEDLIPLFIPSLSAILLAAEKEKGEPLTESEVISIRDNSQTIMSPKSMIKAMAEKRGYEDIDPESVWTEWQLLRKTLNTSSSEKSNNHGAVVLNRPSNDPAMRKAEEKARKTLGSFRQLIEQHSDIIPMIKLRIVDTNTASRMWLFVDKVKDTSFDAHLFEVPSDFEKYHAGDKFTVKDEDILDWMMNNDGNVNGAYTIRVQRDSMNEKERQELDEYMGVTKYLN